MAQAGNQELTDRFIQFYRNYYREAIGTLAQKYPNDQRSLYVDYDDLYQFDRDLADDYLSQPDQIQEYAEEALRLYDLPADVKLGNAHVRLKNLPDNVDIRGIRVHDNHIGKLVSVQGIIRKATDVRPKITDSAFECQRCGTMNYIPQEDGDFQEPHDCQGCEREGPFKINFDQSEFIDAQKLRVQESPEGLRGGETPQSIDINIEDDVTGKVTAGDHVTVTGVLHIEQMDGNDGKSSLFDLYMDGISVTIEDEVFEDMDITQEDIVEITELSNEDDIYDKMVASVAPSIFGYDEEKLAMILQLFSGVTKHLPDGSRIRGDLHMLLIGDPGTGKCVSGDTKVTLADGSEREIQDIVEANLDDPKPVDDGVWDEVDIQLPSLQQDGTLGMSRATKVWKREAPDQLYRITTQTGSSVTVTPSHPLFVQQNSQFTPVCAEDLSAGDFIGVPQTIPSDGSDALDITYRASQSHNAVELSLPDRWTPELARLLGYIVAEGYVEQRDNNTGYVSITNNDEEVLDDATQTLSTLGLNTTIRESHDGKSAKELMCSSGEFVSFLAHCDSRLLTGSETQRVPPAILKASTTIKTAFLKAYIEGEGHVSTTQREVSVASMSRDLLENVRSLLLSVGISSQLKERQNGSYRLRISGDQFGRYVDEVGFVTERKTQAALKHDGVRSNTNLDVVPNIGTELKRIRETLGLAQASCNLPRSTYQHYERGRRNPSRNALSRIVSSFEDAVTDTTTAQTAIASDGGVDTLITDIRALRQLADGDVGWEKIECIETVTPDDEWVYDIEVEETHNYLTNTIISHNSQMLSYIENIAPRSVYTSGKGSSSAGLCVTGDTKIHTAEGFVPIRDLATKYHPEPVDEETAVEATHDLYTYDQDAGAVEAAESSHIWRMPEKPCRRIETAHGKTLETSRNTPVLVCRENGIEWCDMSAVESGDHVAVPKYTDVDRQSPPVRDFFEFTEEKIKPTDESVEFLRTRLSEEFGTLREAAAVLNLSEDFIYDSLSHRHLPLDRLHLILDKIGADLSEIDIDRVMLRHGDSITIPEAFDADLMYLLGLVFGDGDVMVSSRGGNRGRVRISNSDEELLERAADIIEAKFGKRPAIEYQDDRVPSIRLHSATVARFFSNVGVESPKDDIALDPRLTTAEHADAFLEGLFDADGSVCGRTDGGSSIQFSTVCDELAQQVQVILESYGIRARSRTRDRRGTYTRSDGHEIESTSIQTHLAMYGSNLDAFAERIGFRSTTKAASLEAVVGDATRRGERLPLADTLARADGGTNEYWMNCNRGDNPSRERARAMVDDLDLGDLEAIVDDVAEADLLWDEVVAIEDTGRKELFDLTVPETHNFLANGIVTHNTAAAVRDDFGDGQQWTLEAGALVLADRGIAAVDELDKMRCVTGETLVHLSDGQIKRIGELAKQAAETGEIESLPNGRTIRGMDTEVWTMTEDGSLVQRAVTAVHEYDAPELLTEVTLETGEQLTATDDHPFFVREDGTRIERAAAELEAGDWVYVPRSIPSPASDGGVAPQAVAPSTPSPLGQDGPSPALGAVLGYLSGDGNVYYNRSERSYGIRFTNAEEQLLADFERVCRIAFDGEPSRPPSEQRDDGVETVRLYGKQYADTVLAAGMNLETYDGKAFPAAVSAGTRETKAAFVRALADSEGTVDTATGNVRLSSASYELLIGTKELLLEFGVSTQLHIRERSKKRDLHVLALTDAESLAAYARHIGFTLDRKQEALDAVVESASGDRTILDVIPSAGVELKTVRDKLRLYQRECGIDAATYCNFEGESTNISIHRARRVLDAFEDRKQQAEYDAKRLGQDRSVSWDLLTELRERYHIAFSELAEETEYSQQQLSAGWRTNNDLRAVVRNRLSEILDSVVETDLSEFRALVRSDVKWRRVDSVDSVSAEAVDDTVPVLREELTDLLGGDATDISDRARELLDTDPQTDSWQAVQRELDRHGISFNDIATDLDVAGSTVSRWFSAVETDRFSEVRAAAHNRIETVRTETRRLLDAITAAETPKVYDLTVSGTHNFVANGMVVHNSEDRSAMHQALEQQEISISKAGINATLKSRCSLLGAANPKYGRFDQYEPIGEQIDLEPALVSRFDLIFTVTDKPDPEHDGKLADHILKTNYAGELNTQRANVPTSEFTQQQVDDVTEQVAPEIDAELLRKYIAHSKRSCFPTMTDSAKATIREFYVDLRSKGADEDAPIPVTARKLEALVRLAEASARVRLSDTVEEEDAERSVSIVRSCLKDIGVDPETGQFDADVVETGTSKTQRDRIKNIKQLIAEIEDEYEEGAPLDEVLDRAGDIGMDASKAESEIEKLRRKGDVYEPRQGHLRTT